MYSYTEQSSIHRQMNYQLFLRSYQYFYGLDDEEIDLHQEALVTRDSVLGPQYASQDRVTSSTLYKGLFCANKECCGLLIDNLTRSPYCSKQCQVREQNMRQARVKPVKPSSGVRIACSACCVRCQGLTLNEHSLFLLSVIFSAAA